MNIISTKQFSRKFVTDLLEETHLLENTFSDVVKDAPLRGKTMLSIFFQPSTRTRVSFESAMQKLGGGVVTIEDPNEMLALKKGESFKDTVRTIDELCDVIVWRDESESQIRRLAKFSHIPVINAGNGGDEHPTQALLDLYTIKKELGRLENFSCLFIGDLRYGRTIHSLLLLFACLRLSKLKIYLSCPEHLSLPQEYAAYLRAQKINFSYVENPDLPLRSVDVIYLNRIKKEYFASNGEYEQIQDFFVLDQKILDRIKPTAIIVHPLPRTHELSTAIDHDKRAAYWDQVRNGLYMRMALLKKLLIK